MEGRQLLHYELVEQVGEGGMGIVWRALDSSLGRHVAIKLLPEALARDTERLARFEREARLLASLNHPNIAGVYGLHEDGGERFIAMELVVGEDLSERIARGPLPLDEAIDIARGIARALEAAHENGVVHRDLKPANVRVEGRDRVKVLDFGLARAFEAGSGSAADGGSNTGSMAPTMAAGHTVAGLVLGTAAYMSPEQARGQVVDHRADIWAFGCVLYEMLTGRRLFDGETVSDILAEVLKADPDWDALPRETPASVLRVLRRCLARHPGDRLHSIADARLDLEDTEAEPLPATERGPTKPTTPSWRSRLPWWLAAGAVLLAAVAFLRPLAREGPGSGRTVRFTIDIGNRDLRTGDLAFALAPDGSALAYAASVGTSTRIFLRPLDALEATAVPGTEDGSAPLFSPDGQWIAFFANSQLRKVPRVGGTPETLCDVPHAPGGADWSADGRIIYSTAFAGRSGLYRVSADGGDVEVLTRPRSEDGEAYHHWPQILPDQRHVLFTIRRGGQEEVAILSLDSGEWATLPGITGRARYFGDGGASGYLVYGDSNTLLAAPFDPRRRQTTGPPITVLRDVSNPWGGAGASIQLTPNGTLAYLGSTKPQQRLVWVDRQGNVEPLPIEPGTFFWPSLSHDETRLAVSDISTFDGRVYDLGRGGQTALANAIYIFWESDGRHVVYTARDRGVFQIRRRRADGGGDFETLVSRDFNDIITALSPDDRYIAFYQQHPQTGRDIWVLDRQGGGKPEPWLVTPANERSARFSPDGRWIAYTSNRSGRDEVYVRRFAPRGDTDVRVSTEGGREPVWRPDGREIFYRAGNALLAVPIELGEGARVGASENLFEGYWNLDPGGHNQMYVVSAEGQRFLMIENPADLGVINLVLGWSPAP